MEDAKQLLEELALIPTQDEAAEHLANRVNELVAKAEAERNEGPKPKNVIDGHIIESRFGYHKATEITGPLHQAVRGNFMSLTSTLNELLPEGRAKSVCFTELENAAMWANKAVAEMAPVVYE